MLPRKLLNSLLLNNRYLVIKQWLPPATKITQINYLTTEVSKATPTNTDYPLNYSQEESEKIVNLINSSSSEGLARFQITKAGLLKLHLWREEHGELQSPKDLLQIKGINAKTLQTFCNSLLNNEPKTKGASKEFKISSLIIPNLDEVQLSKIRSSVAVHIGVSGVSWSHLQISKNEVEPCLLTDWQYQSIGQKKQHLGALVQECLQIVEKIPHADCYLLENPQVAQASSSMGNADQKNVNIEKAQIIAMLSLAFNARRRELKSEKQLDITKTKTAEKEGETPKPTSAEAKLQNNEQYFPNVFYLRNYFHSRIFRNFVGKEQISSKTTILHLMRNYFTDLNAEDPGKLTKEQRNQICGSVQFMPEQREMYGYIKGFQSEHLGQALLMNLAFVRVVLLQDAASIRLLQKPINKKNKEEEKS